jgi:two-component system sensor histidine kinase UhpB
MTMTVQEAINQVDETAALSKQGAWGRRAYDHIIPLAQRAKRRPLFQKVVIANGVLITAGASLGVYLEKRYFADQELGFLVLFVSAVVVLSILVNYLLIKLAFRPLDEVACSMRAIRSGLPDIRVPEIADDPQIGELSLSLNAVLNSMERQSKRGAASVIKAQEEERKRIARELHDETSQSLTGLVIGVRMIDELLPDSMTEVRERLRGIEDLAQTTLEEVHTMAIRLRPSVLDDLGLLAALRSYIKEFSSHSRVFVELNLPSLSRRLSPDLETVLYRVVQEALTNVVRHADASRCWVTLQQQGDRLKGIISDNGRGFDLRRVSADGGGEGLGLHGIKERIELVGGAMSLESRPGEGSTLYLEVPIESPEVTS